MEEHRLEMLTRQHGIRQKRDDGGICKSHNGYEPLWTFLVVPMRSISPSANVPRQLK